MTQAGSNDNEGDPASGSNGVGDTPADSELEAAITSWINDLLDLSPRNELLHCSPESASNIEVDVQAPQAWPTLFAGDPVAVADLLPDLTDEVLASLKAIRRRALDNWEDRGLNTLALVRGLATWRTQSGRPPSAPVLMVAVELTGRAATPDVLTLQIVGRPTLNPTLRDYARTMLDIELDAARDIPTAELAEPRDVYASLQRAADGVDGFAIDDRVLLGNFSFAKQAMVEDLRNHRELLGASPLVAAMAGSTEPLPRLLTAEADPAALIADVAVLESDGSQTRVLERVLTGESLVVHGPPGTGKSQTIANIVAVLAAAGRSTLFVAEKRAAIEAVLDRLDSVGLGGLVMDLHGKQDERDGLAARLIGGQWLHDSPAPPAADRAEGPEQALRQHLAEVHTSVDPPGMSVWEAIERRIAITGVPDIDPRLLADAVDCTDQASLQRARTALRQLASRPTTPGAWEDAAVASAEDVDRVLRWVDHLMSPTTTVIERAGAVRSPLGLTAALSTKEWSTMTEALRAAEASSAFLEPAAFDLDLAEPYRCLGIRRGGLVATLVDLATSPQYRQACREARSWLRPGCSPLDPEVVGAIEAAADAQRTVASLGARLRPIEPAAVADLEGALQELGPGLRSLGSFLGRSLVDEAPEDLPALFTELRTTRAAGLARAAANDATDVLDELDLLDAAVAAVTAADDPATAVATFDRAHLRAFIDKHRETEEPPDSLRALVAEFSRNDRGRLQGGADRVRRAVDARREATAEHHRDEDRILRNEANRTRPRLTVRNLVAAAPHVAVSHKPCWVMSPLVVSQMLPPMTCFDVVVFDEASQIRPADAIPAIARARQVVVAGDEHQLPPSPFFVSTAPDQFAEDLAAVGGFESILDALGAVLADVSLRWHYRSRDDRLIEFSSRRFYDGLATFPPPESTDCLHHEVLRAPPHLDGESVSRLEAERCAELVVAHLFERPSESLGVVTFGLEHAERIRSALEQAGRADRKVRALIEAERDEPFFVRPVERVQGDERDAILLSVGYPKLHDAPLHLTFGPLNHRGGDRRLNVAVTRARTRMTVVSSFDHTDFPLSADLASGAAALRDFLAWLASASDDPTAAFAGSTLLARVGDPDHPRFGSLARLAATPLPTQPPTALLTDAPATRLMTTRDRYRLRPELLRAAGWEIEWAFGSHIEDLEGPG